MKIEGFLSYLAVNSNYPLTEDNYGCYLCAKQSNFELTIDVAIEKYLEIWQYSLHKSYQGFACNQDRLISDVTEERLQLKDFRAEVQEVVNHYWRWLETR